MKNKKLKIAVFHLAFFYSGGGEKLVLEEIKGLTKRGHEVDCFSSVVEKWICFPDIIGKFKIKTLFPKMPKIIRRQETLEIIITCLLFPLIAWRFGKYDVIFAANQPSPWFAWWVKLFRKTPYVIYLAQPTRILYPRKIDLEKGLWVKKKVRLFPLLIKVARPFILWVDKVSIVASDTMLVNGKYMAKILEKTYGKKAVICPAGAHLQPKIVKNKWKGEVRANSHKISRPYILISNRHFPQKKFEYALEVMPSILKENPGVSLVITGNHTSYTQQLRVLAKKLGVGKEVIFTGYVTEKDMVTLYKNVAVYVYTSPEEDFGMGVIESMAAGTPVVTWDIAGPSTTIIDGKTGFLVEPYLQDEFTKKILFLLNNKAKNILMGGRAIKHVKNNYTYQKHNDVLNETLIKAVSKLR